MPRCTTIFFANDVAQDSGAEDGSGSAVVQDLGDNLSPFPREFHERLTRDMIYVWEVDVGIIFNPGSGKSLLAFILENRRAVAIVKNKAHKEFIMNNLAEEVEMQGLAPDTQPAKPDELTAWETREAAPVCRQGRRHQACVLQQQARLPRQQLGVAPHSLGYPCCVPCQQAVLRHRSQPQGDWLDSASLSCNDGSTHQEAPGNV